MHTTMNNNKVPVVPITEATTLTKFQNDVTAASEHHAKMNSRAKVSIKSRNSCDNAGESSTARVPSEVDF